MIDQDQLREAFLALAAEVPEPYELVGVTFHGPAAQDEWVAFLSSNNPEKPMGCEGWGATPIEALNDLRRHIREEHPEEFSKIG